MQLLFHLKEKGDPLFSIEKVILYLQSLKLAIETAITLWNSSFSSDIFPNFFFFKN